jgi:formylglycine-generating enzyme required for sulfatase activity
MPSSSAREPIPLTEPTVVEKATEPRPLTNLPSLPGEPSVTQPAITNSIDMEFVTIPVGAFTMGSPDSDTDAVKNEKPAHQVTISAPFYIPTVCPFVAPNCMM